MLKDYLFSENKMPEYFARLRLCLKQSERMVFFGAGMGGLNTLQWIKDNVPDSFSTIKCILDNNPQKWNTELMGVPVVKPAKEVLSDADLLVITCGEGDVITDQLKAIGMPEKTMVIIPDISVVDREGKDFSYIWNHINEFEAVYGMLSDDKSKKVFENILNFKISHDTSLISEIYDPFERQYFDEKLIHYGKEDVFMDCGSYTGDTIEYYKKWSTGRFGRVYAIEADRDNYNILKEAYSDDERIIPVNVGLWDEKKELRFDKIGSGSGLISDNGGIVIHTDTIDGILDEDDRLDFIKMDIEGAEYFALVGGWRCIEKYQPALMISVYHKQDDFIRIPMLIKSICPDYNIYFRHYRKMSVQETVCYAIMDNRHGQKIRRIDV